MEINDYQFILQNKINELDSKINRNKYIEKKFEYKFKKKIYDLLQEIGAGIFGGAIRDQLLHEKGSKDFYRFYDQYTTNHTLFIPSDSKLNFVYNKIFLGKPINITYCDKNFNNETYLDRNCIMNDIDCVININLYERLIDKIERIDPSIKIYTKRYNNFNKYINLKDPSKIIKSYMTLYISVTNKFNQIRQYLSNIDLVDADIDIPIFLPMYLKIDLFLYNDDNNIFDALNLMSSNSDFYCNSLYMINNRISINDKVSKSLCIPNYESNIIDINKKIIDIFIKKHIYIYNMIKIIINQIYNRCAYPIRCDVMEKRVYKMNLKNFKIFNEYNLFENIKVNNEICLLCRDNIENKEESIKLICCNSCYHKNCFKEIVNKNKYDIKKPCYMCGTIINYSYIFANYYI